MKNAITSNGFYFIGMSNVDVRNPTVRVYVILCYNSFFFPRKVHVKARKSEKWPSSICPSVQHEVNTLGENKCEN